MFLTAVKSVDSILASVNRFVVNFKCIFSCEAFVKDMVYMKCVQNVLFLILHIWQDLVNFIVSFL